MNPSILFDKPDNRTEAPQAPDFFKDLNLDQVVSAIVIGKSEYTLDPFFQAPLREVETVNYRQGVMRDVEKAPVNDALKAFARGMRDVRINLSLAEKTYFPRQRQFWLLHAAEAYCGAVSRLATDLSSPQVSSHGLLLLRDYLRRYAESDSFLTLKSDAESIRKELESIRYSVLIRGLTVEVRDYRSETDYSVDVLRTFERFKQGAVKDYRIKMTDGPADMNHVEANILDLVAKLHPEESARLDSFCASHAGFMDSTVSAFDREIQFYMAYVEYMIPFKRAGLSFCYPRVSAADKEVFAANSFDTALAGKLVSGTEKVICNDFFLDAPERIIVVSGPNQGGKTTFARMFGQLHYLAALGCPVPGTEARLFLFDRLFTHFEKEESIETLNGKLQDDLVRIRAILKAATPDSIIILNEIFTSTTLEDATMLSRKVMERMIDLDLLGVCVTFIDELASMSPKTVSMMSTVTPENPASRTFKVIRKPADGLAYAISIAEKYGLTYNQIKERIHNEGPSSL